jgi:hypothetical protein
MDLPEITSSTGLNRRFKIHLRVTLESDVYITENEYATLQPSNDVAVIIINTSFSMLQEQFRSCLFVCHELSNEIISEPDSAVIENTNFFESLRIFLPFIFESGWTLVSIDMQRKSVIILGFKGNDVNLKELVEKILVWIARSGGSLVNIVHEEWTSDDRTQNLPSNGTVDSGIYLLMCVYYLATNGKYSLYEANDVLSFRRSLRANLKNSIFPPLPKVTEKQLPQVSADELAVNALLGMMKSTNEGGRK